MTNNPFDNLVKNLLDAMPQSAQNLREDAEKNFRASLEAGLHKLNLVDRTEFDVQKAVLEKTQTQLEELKAKLDELEKQLTE